VTEINEMLVDKILVDKMSVKEMSVDKMLVDELTFDEMSANKMSVNKMSVDEISVDELTWHRFETCLCEEVKFDEKPLRMLKAFLSTNGCSLLQAFLTKREQAIKLLLRNFNFGRQTEKSGCVRLRTKTKAQFFIIRIKY
jgi:hypothetical protein